jgi:amino acid transporter
MKTDVPESYTQDYRHFDNLIWQVPAWATAVFSFSMTAAILVLANATSIERALTIDALRSLSVFLFAIFTALLLFGNVFLRFRLHQRSIHRPHRREVPGLWFMLSGQTSLLLLLFVEASIVLCFALVTAGVRLSIAQILASIFLVGGFLYVETTVRKLSVAIKAKREPKPDAR